MPPQTTLISYHISINRGENKRFGSRLGNFEFGTAQANEKNVDPDQGVIKFQAGIIQQSKQYGSRTLGYYDLGLNNFS